MRIEQRKRDIDELNSKILLEEKRLDIEANEQLRQSERKMKGMQEEVEKLRTELIKQD